MLAVLLACTLTTSEPEVPPELTAADWSAWSGDARLIPTAAELAAELEAAGLSQRVVELAARVSHDTDVVLASLAATRTGAEIGALLLEAPGARPDVRSARLGRIAQGFEVLELDPAPVEVLRGQAMVLQQEAWLARLDAERTLLQHLAAERGDGELPLALAGGWLQALWLVARAAEIERRPEPAHALLHRPEVDAYFTEYLVLCAGERFPDATVEGLQDGLAGIREHAARDPMTSDDVRAVRETAESLLGMM